MIKFGICNEMFEKWKIEDVFKKAKELGYDGVEISPFTLANSVTEITKNEREKIRDFAKRIGIEVIGLHWLLVKPEGLYINHPSKSIREKTSKYLRELVRFCSDIGGRIMVIGSPKQRSVLSSQSYHDTWDRTKSTLKDVLPETFERKVNLCFEPLSPKETNFINTCEEAVNLIEEVNHPNLGLILDVKAMSSEKKPVDDIIKHGGKYLKHFHANDDNGLGPGFGKMDYEKIKNALSEVRYNGYLSVEVFDFSLGGEYIAKKSMENLKKIWRER